ncbi:MAG: thiol protease/hemagglutinin PrtT [Bacteroidales bacterium]|nr:thiol protease/hemagglutinin PrtT [Bacteroidales bacterium]
MKNILCVVFMLFTLVFYANPIDTSTAKKAAQAFVQSQGKLRQKTNPELTLVYQEVSLQKEMDARVYYYIYNVGEAAYVVVSGSDRVIPILAYSDESNFNPNNIPPNMQGVLAEYKREIAHIVSNNIPASEQTCKKWEELLEGGISESQQKDLKPSVAPLLKTTWSQSPYYNNLCPYDSQSHSRAVTGCVATAMAQVINYWAFPLVGYSSHSYVHYKFGYLYAAFDSLLYRYDLMPAALTSTTSLDSVNAVASLMYHCGVAVEMDYGVYESGAYVDESTVGKQSAEYALKTYFGYSDVQCDFRYLLGDFAWIHLLKTELSAGRPLLYRGQGGQGGHAFVCDGYDINDFFHFNWGWGGSSDGYFAVISLNPGGYYDFTSYQGAVHHIIAPNQSGNFHLVLFDDLNLSSAKLGCEEPFTMSTKVLNNGEFPYNGDFRAVVLNGAGSTVANVDFINELHLEPNSDTLLIFSSMGVNGIAAGAYKIKLFYRKTNDTLWLPVLNVGDFVNEVVIVFEGDVSVETDSINGLTATSVNVYGSLSEGCANITATGFKWKKATESKYTTITLQDTLLQYTFTTLEPNTSYNVMAFITTYSGTTYGTVYGKEIIFKSLPLHISIVDTDNIKLYPNPVSEVLYLDIPDNVNIKYITLINAMGQVLKSHTMSLKHQIKLSLEGYAPGVYGVIIGTENSTVHKKIILE